jgi:tRNA pseudouridine55 synthase
MPLKNLVINLDKPKDITSREAVTKASWKLGIKKAGHCGTLDPIATGVLVICTDQATRIAPLVADLPKTYQATMRLGQTTDTQDAYGTILQEVAEVNVPKEKIQQALALFQGTLLQTPPMFSAKKYQGRPLYRLARQGIEVPRQPNSVEVHKITLDNYAAPFVTFTVFCSKGTYVRTLCHDIGIHLGVGAHLSALTRLAVGPFTKENAVALEDLSHDGQGILTLSDALSWLPELIVKSASVRRVKNGNPLKTIDLINLPLQNLSDGSLVKVMSPDNALLLAIGQCTTIGQFQVKMQIVFP